MFDTANQFQISRISLSGTSGDQKKCSTYQEVLLAHGAVVPGKPTGTSRSVPVILTIPLIKILLHSVVQMRNIDETSQGKRLAVLDVQHHMTLCGTLQGRQIAAL